MRVFVSPLNESHGGSDDSACPTETEVITAKDHSFRFSWRASSRSIIEIVERRPALTYCLQIIPIRDRVLVQFYTYLFQTLDHVLLCPCSSRPQKHVPWIRTSSDTEFLFGAFFDKLRCGWRPNFWTTRTWRRCWRSWTNSTLHRSPSGPPLRRPRPPSPPSPRPPPAMRPAGRPSPPTASARAATLTFRASMNRP